MLNKEQIEEKIKNNSELFISVSENGMIIDHIKIDNTRILSHFLDGMKQRGADGFGIDFMIGNKTFTISCNDKIQWHDLFTEEQLFDNNVKNLIN